MIIYILTKFILGVPFSLITSVSIYGYSFTILAPIMFICLVPLEIVKIIALSYGLIHSSIFLMYNLFVNLEEKAQKSKYIILCISLCFQIMLYLVLKFYFFSKIIEVDIKK